MGLLVMIIFGATCGWIASVVMRSNAGLGMDVLLGILGGLSASLVMNLVGEPGITGFNPYSFFVAIFGAILLIWVGRFLLRSESKNVYI